MIYNFELEFSQDSVQSCCTAQIGLSFSFRTDRLTLTLEYVGREELIVNSVTARCPHAVAAQQVQIIHPPPPFLTVGMSCLHTNAMFNFLPKMVLCTMAKHLYFGLVCPQERSLLQFCMLNLYVELMMFRIGSFSLDVLKAGAAANEL